MSDDISLFHPRMRKPAVYSLVFGMILGFLAIGTQRQTAAPSQPWALAVVLGLLAAAFLYGVMYRNLSQQLSQDG